MFPTAGFATPIFIEKYVWFLIGSIISKIMQMGWDKGAMGGGRETINESFCIESDGDVKESGCCVGSIVKLISAIYWANLPDGNVVEVFPICRSTAPVSPPARPTVANIGSVA